MVPAQSANPFFRPSTTKHAPWMHDEVKGLLGWGLFRGHLKDFKFSAQEYLGVTIEQKN